MPENKTNASGNTGSAEGQTQGSGDAGQTTGMSNEELVGQYQELMKKHEALEKQLQDSQSHIGRRDNELGQLRNQIQQLEGTLQDYNEEISSRSQQSGWSSSEEEIQRLMNDGEFTRAYEIMQRDMSAQAENLASEKANEAINEFQSRMMYDQFMREHPDYAEMTQTGVLQDFMQSNPVYAGDPIAAYNALKVQQLQATMEERVAEAQAAGKEEGKSEIQALAEGSQAQSKTITEPGSSAQNLSNGDKEEFSFDKMVELYRQAK